jgi:uncharacterized protein
MRIAILMIASFFSSCAILPNAANSPAVPGLPLPYHWRNDPASWNVSGGLLTIQSQGKTDWYAAPTGGAQVASSPVLLFPAASDFWFSAKVTVDFKSQFDAGALIVYADEKTWVKFAFESPNGKSGAIVSVVTRGLSDDNTGTAIAGNSVYLKISKTGQAIFLYFSTDGKNWNLTRAFNLGSEGALYFGFSAQSPTGTGATAVFSDIHYKPDALKPWTGN